METSPQRLVRELAARLPAIKRLLDEHSKDNRGELLPHVLFYDIARWSVAAVHMDPSSDEYRQARDLLEALDDELRTGDEDVRNVIAVSFVESLPYRWEEGSDIRDLLGPTLLNELELQRGDQ